MLWLESQYFLFWGLHFPSYLQLLVCIAVISKRNIFKTCQLHGAENKFAIIDGQQYHCSRFCSIIIVVKKWFLLPYPPIIVILYSWWNSYISCLMTRWWERIWCLSLALGSCLVLIISLVCSGQTWSVCLEGKSISSECFGWNSMNCRVVLDILLAMKFLEMWWPCLCDPISPIQVVSGVELITFYSMSPYWQSLTHWWSHPESFWWQWKARLASTSV